MPRDIRFVPAGALVEVTTRTIQGRYLLSPSRDLNEIVTGLLARSARRYGVRICGYSFPSNHEHLLVRPEDARELAGFMNYFNGNLAREAGRLYRWRAKFWSRRYRAIVVSDEPEAQIGRLRYLLSQGCKEGLVRSPRDWPGASSTEALLGSGKVGGVWFDRTKEYELRRRGGRQEKYSFATEEEVDLVPIPCWDHLSPTERRDRVREMVSDIESETRQALRRTNSTVVGRRRILRQNPHHKPEREPRRPAPRFHAASQQVRRALESSYRVFLIAFRAAAEELRVGAAKPCFPEGSFPPALPFSRGHPGGA